LKKASGTIDGVVQGLIAGAIFAVFWRGLLKPKVLQTEVAWSCVRHQGNPQVVRVAVQFGCTVSSPSCFDKITTRRKILVLAGVGLNNGTTP
jgi:hypothetical protein